MWLMTASTSPKLRQKLARGQARRRQGRRRQGATRVAVHRAEPRRPLAVRPGGPRLGDVLVPAPDEVPPHDDLLRERLAADQEQPGSTGSRQYPGRRTVKQVVGLENSVVDGDRTGHDDDRVFEVGPQ